MENDTRTKARRARRGREEIEELLEAFEAGGQTQEAFCRERGLSVSTFWSWRRKRAAGGEAAGAGLRPVRLVGASCAGAATVRAPGGTEVVLPPGTPVAEIAALVAALEGGRPC